MNHLSHKQYKPARCCPKLLKINILYSTSRLDIFQDRRTVFRAAAPNQNPSSRPAVTKVAENQYFICPITRGYFPRSENGLPGGCPEPKPARPVRGHQNCRGSIFIFDIALGCPLMLVLTFRLLPGATFRSTWQ